MVRYEHRRQTGLGGSKGTQGRQQRLAGRKVETAGRFVEEEDFRLGHERPGQPDPLALALRTGADRVVGECRQAEQRFKFFRPAYICAVETPW